LTAKDQPALDRQDALGVKRSSPSLDPWCNRTTPPSERFVLDRNPFYHRIDTAGHQLPYIDTFQMSLGTNTLIPAKTASDDSDLQARYLNFGDYTFLKGAESRQNYTVRLWEKGEGSAVAIMPNLNAADPEWRKLMRNDRSSPIIFESSRPLLSGQRRRHRRAQPLRTSPASEIPGMNQDNRKAL
jgi:hypothetical protein